jgi:hypothetical protein
MKVTVIVNRHIAAANKKNGKDDPCISINTSAGVIYCKSIEFVGHCKLIQDAEHPRACGATIWIETQLENLLIDGKPGSREMLSRKSTKPQQSEVQPSLF